MSRIVLGNRGSALSLAQARSVFAELTAEWPDVNIVQRIIQARGTQNPADALLGALAAKQLSIVATSLDELPAALPDGLTIAAVTRRLEPRSTLINKGQKGLSELSKGALIGVRTHRDATFLLAQRSDLRSEILSGGLDEDLAQLANGHLEALVLPAYEFIQLDRRNRLDTLLEVDLFTPAAGQGSLGLVVRHDDDLAFDLAYTLQHRPSADRASAERSFAARLLAHSSHAVGALATISGEGELRLFGAVAAVGGGLLVQAEVTGEAAEAAELGRELAEDVLAQLA